MSIGIRRIALLHGGGDGGFCSQRGVPYVGHPCGRRHLIPGCHVGVDTGAAKAASAIKELHSQLNSVKAGLANLKLLYKSAQQPQTSFSGTEFGLRVEGMLRLQDAAPASTLPPPPTSEQWTTFFVALGLPEQPDNADWVELLYPRQLDALRNRKRKANDGFDCKSRTHDFRLNQPVPESRDKVHLAVGWIIRALEFAGAATLQWRDTSRSGVRPSSHKPAYVGYVYPAEVWTSAVSPATPLLVASCSAPCQDDE